MGVGHRDALGFGELVEGFVELGVVGSEIDQCAAFAAHQVVEGGVVVAFVESPDDEHRGLSLCVECHEASVDVSGLGVVDILHAVETSYAFESMFHAGKIGKTAGQRFLVHTRSECCEGCRLAVAQVVFARQGELCERDGEGARLFDDQARSFGETVTVVAGFSATIGCKSRAGVVGEGQLPRGMLATC